MNTTLNVPSKKIITYNVSSKERNLHCQENNNIVTMTMYNIKSLWMMCDRDFASC